MQGPREKYYGSGGAAWYGSIFSYRSARPHQRARDHSSDLTLLRHLDRPYFYWYRLSIRQNKKVSNYSNERKLCLFKRILNTTHVYRKRTHGTKVINA